MTRTDAMTRSAPTGRPGLAPAEALLLATTLLLGGLEVGIATIKGQAVDWYGFSISFLPCIGLAMAGIYARFRGMERVGLLAMGLGIYIGFAGVASILIYLMFPLQRPLIDSALIRLDALLGYSWPAFVDWLAHAPRIGNALHYVYLSSLWQIFALVSFLALTGRRCALHRLMLTGAAGLMLAIGIWCLFPSMGPSMHATIPAGTAARINLYVDAGYVETMRHLATEGISVITPESIIGTIAFPSYHTVMALMVVFHARGTSIFWPLAALNTAMVPAILAHGGHHLVDVFGGLAVFVLAAWLARRLVPSEIAQTAIRGGWQRVATPV